MKKTLLALFLALAAPALAVVPSTSSYIDQTGNGATTAFAFTFPVTTSASHVEVLVAGVKQVSGYTVALNANQTSSPGGTVTFTAAPGNGLTVRIQRTVPLTQETVYTPYSAFPAKTTERALDRVVYQAQQVDRRVAEAETTHVADRATDLAAQATKDQSQDNAIANVGTGTATGDSLVTAPGTSQARALAARAKDHGLSPEDCGATTASANNSANFQECVDALETVGGGVLNVPPGTWRANFKVGDNITIRGHGRATIIKAVAGSNAAVIEGKNFATLTGKTYAAGDINAGDNYVHLENLTIDGDKSTQTSGWGIRLWGRSYNWRNVIVQNCKSGGIWTEFTTHPGDSTEDALEAYYSDIKVNNNDGDGWTYRGPHDSLLVNFVTFKNTGYGFRNQGTAGGYNGGISGVNWNGWTNTLGAYKFEWTVPSLLYFQAAGAGTVGVDVAADAGAVTLLGGIIMGNGVGAILRGFGQRLEGNISGNTTAAVRLAGCSGCLVDVVGTTAAGGSVFDVVSEAGPNTLRAMVSTNGTGSLVSGAALRSDDDVRILDGFTGSGLLDVIATALLSRPTNTYAFDFKAASGWPVGVFRTPDNAPIVTIDSVGRLELERALLEASAAPAYGASVAIDAVVANEHVITATNGTAFTIANPLYAVQAGQRITIKVKNASGGVLGAVTWGTAFKLAAWTSPANGFSRSIDFRYDGANWVEVSRTPADVPN